MVARRVGSRPVGAGGVGSRAVVSRLGWRWRASHPVGSRFAWRPLVAMALGVAWLVAGGAGLAWGAPSLVLPDDATVTAGEQLRVSGSGFTPGRPVSFHLDDVSADVAPVGSAATGADGTVDVLLTIPLDTPGGEYVLVACLERISAARADGERCAETAAVRIQVRGAVGGGSGLLIGSFVLVGVVAVVGAAALRRRDSP